VIPLSKKKYTVYSRDLKKVKRTNSFKEKEKILEEDSPEYKVKCPNCKCEFGVN
jgi:hypothetical protein